MPAATAAVVVVAAGLVSMVSMSARAHDALLMLCFLPRAALGTDRLPHVDLTFHRQLNQLF